MSAAVKLRDEMGADELRAMARESRDSRQCRRLLALAAARRSDLVDPARRRVRRRRGQVHAERRRRARLGGGEGLREPGRRGRGSSAPWLGLMRREGKPRAALPARSIEARAVIREGWSATRRFHAENGERENHMAGVRMCATLRPTYACSCAGPCAAACPPCAPRAAAATPGTSRDLDGSPAPGPSAAAAAETPARPAAGPGAGAEGGASPPPGAPATRGASANGGEADTGEGAVGEIAELAQIRQMVRQLAEHTKEEVVPKLDRLDTKAKKTLAGTVEANGAALREFLEARSDHGAREGRAAEAADRLGDEIRVHTADFQRWYDVERRLRRRWSSLALAVAVPAFLLLGVLVERQFEIIPLDDPTGGWRGHVWENYGRGIVDCATEAQRTGSEVECSFTVRKP